MFLNIINMKKIKLFVIFNLLFLSVFGQQVIEGVSNNLYIAPLPKPNVVVSNYSGNVLKQKISTIHLTVKNNGDGDAENVKVKFILPTNVFPTDKIEYSLGTINAGSYQDIDFSFLANASYTSNQLSITAELSEKLGKYSQNKSMVFQLQTQEQEVLQISDFQLADNNKNNAIDGNEIAMISLKITNPTSNTVNNLRVNISIPDYVIGISYPTSQVVGSLSANQSRTITIPITGTSDLQSGEIPFSFKAEADNGIVSPKIDFNIRTKMYLPPEIAQTTDAVEKTISDQLTDYTQQMRDKGIISENVNTNVQTDIYTEQNNEGEQELNLKVEYKYEIINKTIKQDFSKQTDDFPPGAYAIKQSNAARILMTVFKKTVEDELTQYLTEGKKVTIKISGMTDASKINGKINYANEFGDLLNKELFYNELIDDVTITQSSGITSNKQLGFLRTWAVRDFIEKYVGTLSVAAVSYEHYVEVSNKVGGEYRKIEIELVVHDAFSEKYPELVEQVLKSDVDVGIPENNLNATNTYAIVIGNENYSKYQTSLTSLSDVDYAINDAKIFNIYLQKTFGIPENNITFLPDAQRHQMLQALNKMSELMKRNPNELTIIFYYAGHGVPDKDSLPYLLPVDIAASDFKNEIALSFLYGKLSEYPAKRVMVFLDACFSGGGRKQGPDPARTGIYRTPKKTLNSGKIFVFASSSGSQVSLPYNSKGHGLYTYFLLKIIKQNKGDLTLKQLVDLVSKKVSNTAISELNKAQDPQEKISPDIINEWQNWKLLE